MAKKISKNMAKARALLSPVLTRWRTQFRSCKKQSTPSSTKPSI